MRFGHDVLETAPILDGGRSMGEAPACALGLLARSGPTGLVAGCDGCLHRARKKGGPKTGPNPTDRAKPGTKRHLVTDREGIPLAETTTAANVNETRMLETVLDSIPPVRGKPGRPRKRPEKLHADKGYRSRRNQQILRKRGVKSRIARPKIESSERLGRHRWVVERTFAWLNQMRRLVIRYERRDDIYDGLLQLGCSLICFRFLQQAFC